MHNMIADRGDWCISRQRAWGVPLPIIYCEDGTPIMEEEVFEHIANLFEKEGSNVWFKYSEKELLPEGYTNAHSPNGEFKKETDIMDVWFDSGSSHTSALRPRGHKYPVDLYLEGSDQYRGWFNSSLIIGTAVHGEAPYKSVVSHGFIMDDKNQKFSKSLGNGVAPQDVIKQYGADILRLWVGTVAYQSDVKISMDLIKQVAESYRKIRNTFKFMLGNLSDGNLGKFDINKDKASELSLLDKFVVEKLHLVVNNYLECFDNYDFAGGVNEIMNFMSNDLSSFYLDLAKDILYCEEYDSLRRRQVQTVIYEVVDTLLRLLTPIIPFTMEEVYDFFKDETGAFSSQLLDMPKKYKNIDEELLAQYASVLSLRSDVLKAIEELRGQGIIKSSQEANVRFEITNDEVKKVVSLLEDVEITRLFIVSSAKETNNLDAKEYTVAKVLVNVHDGARCERCWNRFEANLLNSLNICPRCDKAMKKVGF